jgi:hypothetical protein
MIARVAISLGISATCFPAKRGRCRLSEGQKLSKDQAPEGRLASPKPRSGPEEFPKSANCWTPTGEQIDVSKSFARLASGSASWLD